MLTLAQVIIQRLNTAKVRYGNLPAIEKACCKALRERTRECHGHLELYGTEQEPRYVYVVYDDEDEEEEEICFYADEGEWICHSTTI